ncbi:MAG: hypothetical protein HOY79_31335 [Streptomyces sp.]|nr:hypothetical protein [Streptomyces sp.]
MSTVKTTGAVGVVGGLGSAAAVVAAVSWPGVAVVVAVIALPLGGMLWVLNSRERSRHLMLMITAIRGGAGAAVTPPALPASPTTLVPGTTEHEPDYPVCPR